LLILSGPAGAGKSTTVQSLAENLGFEIVEWINPVDENRLTTQTDGPTTSRSYLIIETESLSRKFSLFLQSSQRYTSLETGSNHLVLIQDLPNTIGSSSFVSQTRFQFQSSLKEFLLSSRVRYPVVLIVTESEVGAGEDFGYSSTYREGLTVKGLLGDDILNHPAITHITYSILFPF
jgi:cell cycle checkpoint protein